MTNPIVSPANNTRLILLGTKGGPRVTSGRANPANVVMIDAEPWVIDCGYGVTRQLIAAGIEPQQVRKILITHHHSDHVIELGPLIYNIWACGLRDPIDVWGPPPLRRIIDSFFQSMTYDIDIRIEDEKRVDLRTLVRVHEFEAPGIVCEANGVKISAAAVRHPPLTHAYAYRVDAPDRSIVLSGDTRYCPEIIEFAQGADVLLHEVMHLDGIDRLVARMPGAARLREHLMAAHTTTKEVGKVAAAAGAKTLVLNHFVPGDDLSITDDMWRADPAKDFAGSLLVGHDLQTI
jgi:ribonuclease BN (tRNA processing enzyme)